MGSELDLDALAAIVGKRTPGELYLIDGFAGIYASNGDLVATAHGGTVQASRERATAIVAAVNAIRPLIERCKRAEASLFLPEGDMIDFYKKQMVEHRDAAIQSRKQVAELEERCKRAEAEVIDRGKQLVAEIADLIRQRNELLHMVDQVRLNTDQLHIREACRELHNRVKGGTDGKAKDARFSEST